MPERFDNVTLTCKANIYFDGRVVSHTIVCPGGDRKTIGLIYPGSYRFSTEAPERMEIIAGTCRARLEGAADWTDYPAGSHFDVAGNSAFDILVEKGIAEYLCSFG